jgi:phosphoribulokinase
VRASRRSSTGQRPFVLGIVGDSAAGKTTVTRGLIELLGRERVTHVCIDDYHRYDRRERLALGMTPLHPDCNHVDIIELHLERLHYGQPILKPVYDHSIGTLVRPEYVLPREFVIVEGLLGFHTPVMRQFYDVKVYLDPTEELRRFWKVRRDTTKRGYTTEQVLTELERREPDSRAFIRPQREYADIAARFMPPAGERAEEAGPHLNVRLTLRPGVPHPNLSYLVGDRQTAGAGIRLIKDGDSLHPVEILEIDGNVTPEHAGRLEEAIWQHLPELSALPADRFGNYLDLYELRHSDPLALTQLLLTCQVLRGKTELAFAEPVAALSRLRVPRETAADWPIAETAQAEATVIAEGASADTAGVLPLARPKPSARPSTRRTSRTAKPAPVSSTTTVDPGAAQQPAQTPTAKVRARFDLPADGSSIAAAPRESS